MTEQIFRTARVFDGTGIDGRPEVERQLLDETESVRVLAYLESAPVILNGQGFGPDRVDSTRAQQVPLTWQTDGTWVWPGAVTYYLRTYAMPPDPDLLAHIRQSQYRVPTISAASTQAALAALSGSTAGSTAGAQEETHVSPSPALSTSASDDSAAFDRLRAAAVDLGAPAGAYRIGAAADGVWCLRRDGARWAVFLAEHGARNHAASFDTSQQAIAYLVGQLYFASRPAQRPDAEDGAQAPAQPDQLPFAGDDLTGATDGPASGGLVPGAEQPGIAALLTPTEPVPSTVTGLAAATATAAATAATAGGLIGSRAAEREGTKTGAGTPPSAARSAPADAPAPPDHDPARPAVTDPASMAADPPALTGRRGTATPAATSTAAQTSSDTPTSAGPDSAPTQPGRSAPTSSSPDTPDTPDGAPASTDPDIPAPADRGAARATGAPVSLGTDTPAQPDSGTPAQPGTGAPTSRVAGAPLSADPAQPGRGAATPRTGGAPAMVSPRAATVPEPSVSAGAQPSPISPGQWKIQPVDGEPPLTLYRDKRMVMLPAGTEVDRYGEPVGNVTYAARTQYQHRSLPADWINFPYHVYRLQRPLEALTGFAVPWFEQPGGGTAFVLPRPISELLADGSLIELSEQTLQPAGR